MKWLCGLLLAIGLLAFAVAFGPGCYPTPVCTPTDTSCLPCSDPRNTNPACPPFPGDTKRPDGGTDR